MKASWEYIEKTNKSLIEKFPFKNIIEISTLIVTGKLKAINQSLLKLSTKNKNTFNMESNRKLKVKC